MANQELLAKLNAYVNLGAHSVGAANAAFLEDCLDEAVELVDAWCGAVVVPEAILHRAYIECASDLYQRQKAPQGVTQYTSDNGSAAPIRTSRDPMGGARLILASFLPGGFA